MNSTAPAALCTLVFIVILPPVYKPWRSLPAAPWVKPTAGGGAIASTRASAAGNLSAALTRRGVTFVLSCSAVPLRLVPKPSSVVPTPGPLQWYMALIAGLSILCFLNAGIWLAASLIGYPLP